MTIMELLIHFRQPRALAPVPGLKTVIIHAALLVLLGLVPVQAGLGRRPDAEMGRGQAGDRRRRGSLQAAVARDARPVAFMRRRVSGEWRVVSGEW